jgi:hypothetical protein
MTQNVHTQHTKGRLPRIKAHLEKYFLFVDACQIQYFINSLCNTSRYGPKQLDIGNTHLNFGGSWVKTFKIVCVSSIEFYFFIL